MSQNITYVDRNIDSDERWRCNGHKGGATWFTGLSASGKSTLAAMLEQSLFQDGY